MTDHSKLPQMNGVDMTCGGGFETWLQYVDGFELRHFCAFELLNDKRGVACLTDYHRKLVEAAVSNGFGVINVVAGDSVVLPQHAVLANGEHPLLVAGIDE